MLNTFIICYIIRHEYTSMTIVRLFGMASSKTTMEDLDNLKKTFSNRKEFVCISSPLELDEHMLLINVNNRLI